MNQGNRLIEPPSQCKWAPEVEEVFAELERLEQQISEERTRNASLEAESKQATHAQALFMAMIKAEKEAHARDVSTLEAMMHQVMAENKALTLKLERLEA